MRKREVANCDAAASCLMFFNICRSATADEEAHHHERPREVQVKAGTGRTGARKEFLKVTAQGLGGAEDAYSNPESLPSLEVSFHLFARAYPRFRETRAVDALREREYAHLGEDVCLDYSGFGLFSQRASSFNLAYISANLPTHALYGAAEHGTLEAFIRSRIMRYMNLSDADYSMVFTASRGTAYKLLAESYPFECNNRLLTVYDYESDAVSWMAGAAKEKGAKIMNASFKWPNLKIAAPDLRYKLQEKKKKKEQSAKGLFVFPVQSRVTGAKYSYQWMSQAQANKWHVLLDASALAPKDMDSLALSLFRPEFIVTSFYKVFGADPTGFGCLFIKNSIIQGLHNSDRARGVGMVRIIAPPSSSLPRELSLPDIHEDEYVDAAEYVDPVSAFSGPITQFYAENMREKAVLERITSSGRDMNIAGFDDSSGRMSEEDWDGSHGDGEFSGRESGSGEIEVEASEAVFPLTRRGGGAEEREEELEEDFSFKVVKDPEMEDDDERFLEESRVDNNRFLSRIQEEETDECDDVSPPHEDDSPEGGNGSLVALGSPLFHSPSESPDSFEDRLGLKQVEEENVDRRESSIMFRDDRDFALREGRDVDSFFEEDQILPAEPEGSNGGHSLGASGANGRRLQSWSPGEGSSQWEAQYAMSEEGSPMYLDDDNGNVGESADEMFDDEEGPVVCNGLDHADSQGLNKTNLRLRFLINWLINSLLKLRHPAQIDSQGTNLVHIYGPEVHFDRGHAIAFNLFDWNGVPVRSELVQRLADRNNISLGLGTLCNIVYPEGLTDLAGLWLSKGGAEGGSNEGGNGRPSNASKHERPSEIPVVTAALGFVSTFEDVYRLWAFVAKFLDADFVKREEWLYHSLNQEIHVL